MPRRGAALCPVHRGRGSGLSGLIQPCGPAGALCRHGSSAGGVLFHLDLPDAYLFLPVRSPSLTSPCPRIGISGFSCEYSAHTLSVPWPEAWCWVLSGGMGLALLVGPDGPALPTWLRQEADLSLARRAYMPEHGGSRFPAPARSRRTLFVPPQVRYRVCLQPPLLSLVVPL